MQLGTTAHTTESLRLEAAVRAAVAELADAFDGLEWRRGYTGAELAALLGIPDARIAGVEPDGGVWVRDGRPVVVAEAKRQGERGNAIERWYKNWSVFRRLGVRTYVTFCAGDGFFDHNSAQRIIETAVAVEDDPARVGHGRVWNTPAGRLWLYRYRRGATVGEVTDVLSAALTAAADTPAVVPFRYAS